MSLAYSTWRIRYWKMFLRTFDVTLKCNENEANFKFDKEDPGLHYVRKWYIITTAIYEAYGVHFHL